MKMRCLYCGKNELNIPGNPYLNDTNTKEPYKCDNCGIQCSQQDIDQDAKRLKTTGYFPGMKPANPDNGVDENRVLHSAWELMKKGEWDMAFAELWKKGGTYEHPLEFIIFRSLCQAAVLFSRPKATPSERCQKLDILINNLNSLNYYLPDDDKAGTFNTFKRITDALMLLGDLTIKYPDEKIKDHTNYRRAIILSGFADVLELETIGNSQYCAEYLKLGVQLLHKSLDLAQEKPTKFLPYFEEQLCLPTSERLQINAKIKKLNSQIKMRDPGFSALQPPPLPKVMPPPLVRIMKFSVTMCGASLVLYIGYLVVCSFLKSCSISTSDLTEMAENLFWAAIIIISIAFDFVDNWKRDNSW